MTGFRNRAAGSRGLSTRDAAAWWAVQDDAVMLSPEAQAEHKAWLNGDPSRAEAYDHALAALDTLSAHAGEPEVLDLRRRALAAQPDRAEPSWSRAAAALMLVIALGAAGAWLIHPKLKGDAPSATDDGAVMAELGAHGEYRTAVGERSTFTLADGSVVTLDTDSLLRVDYSPQARAVRLIKGQALFQVAKHKPAPFEVYAGDRRITAVGTLFDVRLDRGGISVALIEGRIRVAQIEGDPRRVENGDAQILLAAGEVLDTRTGGPMRVRQADLTRIDSWKDGVLEFDDEPLAEAVRELNRYNVRPIVLKDRALANLRVTGVFKTGAPDRFAQTMAEIFPIEARTGDDGALILSSKSSY